MTSLQHLMSMGTKGRVCNNAGESIVSKQNLAGLEGIPILFFSGAENAVFSPESTDMSYNALRDAFGGEDYERVVFQGKGHLDCWMGVDAESDVYPRVKAHVEKSLFQVKV